MACGLAFGQDKIKVNNANELPTPTIQLPEGKTAWEIINDRALLDGVASQVETAVADLLDKYAIEDKATLNGYYGTQLQLAMYKHEPARVKELIGLLRGIADKEADRLTTGQMATALLTTYDKHGKTINDAFAQAFEQQLYSQLSELPYDVIRESVEATKGQYDILTANLIQNSVEAQMQQVLNNMGTTVPVSVGAGFIGLRYALDVVIPLKDALKGAYTRVYDENKTDTEVVNIWTEREAALGNSLTPVNIAIWDTGVDMDVLEPNNHFTNANEVLDGKDTDGNGFVDDVHGIAYNPDREAVSHMLAKGDLKEDIKDLQRYIQGSMDQRAGIESEALADLRKKIGSLTKENYASFMEELSFYGTYAHGTHVAGIAAAGNPAAKIAVARFEYSTATIPTAPTKQSAKAGAKMYKDIIAWYKANNIQVVNMSWRYSQSFFEGALRANGIGKNEEEVKKMAAKLYKIERDALYDAIASAPEILFVAGSGNENNDSDFEEYMPASFDLPNLITVGAVDSEGKRTSFTSEGASIDCYANGYEIESFVPGGDRIKFSGTSMSSPQVANLAGKLLATNPNLTVAQLRSLILDTCDTSDEGVQLINPKAALARLSSTGGAGSHGK